jgi:hypothetical protein
MSFEDAYKLMTSNFPGLLKNIYFFPRNADCYQLPSHILKEEKEWNIGVSVNDNYHWIQHLSDVGGSIKNYALSREDDELMFERDSYSDNVEIFLFRDKYKNPNPIEDKIKMLQEQIDELKKQVIL